MNLVLKQFVNPVLAKLKAVNLETWAMMGLMVVMLVSMIEPSWADLFTSAGAKVTSFKTALIAFGKILVVAAFVCSVIMAISGRINWAWTGCIAVVALILMAVDAIATFFEMG